ncbi:MAG: hypothetical protein ACJ790_19630 [Myxococcaceae bacterium]
MAPIKIAPVKTAAASLSRKVAKMDTNKDGKLSDAELGAARKAGGDVDVHAVYKLRQSMLANWWGGSDGPGDLTVSDVKAAINNGVAQLEGVDSYAGNKAKHKPGNTKDGVVTDAEIKNYGPGYGKLQRFASDMVWYTDAKAKTAPSAPAAHKSLTHAQKLAITNWVEGKFETTTLDEKKVTTRPASLDGATHFTTPSDAGIQGTMYLTKSGHAVFAASDGTQMAYWDAGKLPASMR